MFANYILELREILKNLSRYLVFRQQYLGEECFEIKSVICEIESLIHEIEKLDDETDTEQINYFNCLKNYIDDLLLDIDYSEISSFSIEGSSTFLYPPSNIQLTQTISSVIVDWDIVSNTATGHSIQRSVDEINWTTIGEVDGNTNTFTDDGLLSIEGLGDPPFVYYRVLSRFNESCSTPSQTSSVLLTVLAPTNLVSDRVLDTSAIISWDDNSDNETNFEVYRSDTMGVLGALIATLPADTNTYEDTTLTEDTTYYYQVRAIGIVESDFSNELEITTFIPFTTIWTTNLAGGISNNDQISLPLLTGGTPVYSADMHVQWGDSLVDNITVGNQAEVVHTYAAEGTYTIKITGTTIRGFSFASTPNPRDNTKLIEISRWSNLQPIGGNGQYSGCTNMEITTTDPLDLSFVVSLNNWFSTCTSLTGVAADFSVWDTSSILDLQNTFRGSPNFNPTGIGSWDVSNVVNMNSTFFACSSFNKDISAWNVGNVLDFGNFLAFCSSYNQPMNTWDVSSATSLFGMFSSASVFNQPLNTWVTTNNTTLTLTFDRALAFNQDISSWDTGNVTAFVRTFEGAASFNQPLDNWDVSSGLTFQQMFKVNPAFNQPLNSWNMSNATSLNAMFQGASTFSQDLNNWDVSNVQDFSIMFAQATAFNGNIDNWNTGSATLMPGMFSTCLNFNRNISGWNIANVTDTNSMFSSCTSFNQNIGGWDMSNVTTIGGMLNNAQVFNQDISGWNIISVTTGAGFLQNANAFSTANYDLLLNAWSLLAVQPNVVLDVNNTQYTIVTSQAARDILTNAPNNWTITDSGGI